MFTVKLNADEKHTYLQREEKSFSKNIYQQIYFNSSGS